jgi:hypothetical protein
MESVFGTAGELTPAVLSGGLLRVGSGLGDPAEGSV